MANETAEKPAEKSGKKISVKMPKINYKLLIIIPAIIVAFSIVVLVNQYMTTGEWFIRSIELKGGTLVTINSPNKIDVNGAQNVLEGFGKFSIRETSSINGYGVIISMSADVDTQNVTGALKNIGIDEDRLSIESIGPALGSSFWLQAQIAIAAAFIFMAVVVFLIFRIFIPSVAVILGAVSDIVCTLAFMQIFGIELSLSSLAAVLMLIGYSVDTDIMSNTKMLKQGGKLMENLTSAVKTGLTMTLTTIGALAALLVSYISPVLSQIASVLIIGLVMDMIFTWLQNSVMLRWYCEKKGIGS
jgi:preprotein translocase subunit SecF